jgi:hypothetical protein
MRADTKGKHGIRKRFAIVIGVAAVGVMALGTQTAAQTPAPTPPAPAVVKYDTTLTITHEAVSTGGTPKCPPLAQRLCRKPPLPKGAAQWHGRVESDRTECMGGRRVILFKQRPGADRKLGVAKSALVDGFPYGQPAGDFFGWGAALDLQAPIGGRVYARVSPKAGDGFVCRADRSLTITHGKLRDKEQPFTPLPTT